MATASIDRSAFWSSAGRLWMAVPWRAIFTRLPLPMLALAASYGVFRFSSFFAPSIVAIIQAAAFELTYIGLSAMKDLTPDARRRAQWISGGAVVVSIVYNSLAGAFERNPEWLASMPVWAEWTLAIMHGLPLALVAYLVADLVLHGDNTMSGALTAAIDKLKSDLAAAQQLVADVQQALTAEQQTTAALRQQLTSAQQTATSAGNDAATNSRLVTEWQQAAAEWQARATALEPLATQAQQLAATLEQTQAAARQEIAKRDQLLAETAAALTASQQIGAANIARLAALAKQSATWDQVAAALGINVSAARRIVTGIQQQEVV